MRFEKITNNGKTTYYINDCEVGKFEYDAMIKDDEQNDCEDCGCGCDCDGDCENCEECDDDDGCCDEVVCPECRELLNFIYALEEMDDDVALASLKDKLDDAYDNGCKQGYKDAYKHVHKLTGEIIDAIEEMETDEFTDDDDAE